MHVPFKPSWSSPDKCGNKKCAIMIIAHKSQDKDEKKSQRITVTQNHGLQRHPYFEVVLADDFIHDDHQMTSCSC